MQAKLKDRIHAPDVALHRNQLHHCHKPQAGSEPERGQQQRHGRPTQPPEHPDGCGQHRQQQQQRRPAKHGARQRHERQGHGSRPSHNRPRKAQQQQQATGGGHKQPVAVEPQEIPGGGALRQQQLLDQRGRQPLAQQLRARRLGGKVGRKRREQQVAQQHHRQRRPQNLDQPVEAAPRGRPPSLRTPTHNEHHHDCEPNKGWVIPGVGGADRPRQQAEQANVERRT